MEVNGKQTARNLFLDVCLWWAQSFEMLPSGSTDEIYSKLVIFNESKENFH